MKVRASIPPFLLLPSFDLFTQEDTFGWADRGGREGGRSRLGVFEIWWRFEHILSFPPLFLLRLPPNPLFKSEKGPTDVRRPMNFVWAMRRKGKFKFKNI